MTDIQYWQDTLASEIESIQNILASVPNLHSDMDKSAAIDDAEKQLRSANGNKRSFKMEIRLITDASTKRACEEQMAEYEKSLTAITEDINRLRAENSRNQLFLNADTGEQGERTAQEDGDAMLNQASHLQDKTAASLNNTQVMVGEAKMVGMQTVEELQRQRDQIRNIDDDVNRLEDNLARADKLIKTFGKRMATDKLIQCFACTNLLLIVAVIIYAIVKGGLTNDKDSGVPEDPVDGAASTGRMLRGWLTGEE
jgi:SNARE protein